MRWARRCAAALVLAGAISLGGAFAAAAFSNVKVDGRTGNVFTLVKRGFEGKCVALGESGGMLRIRAVDLGTFVTGWKVRGIETLVGYRVQAQEVETGRTFVTPTRYASAGPGPEQVALGQLGVVATKTPGNHLIVRVLLDWYNPITTKRTGGVTYRLTRLQSADTLTSVSAC